MRALIISIPTILVAAGILGVAACSAKSADTDESPGSTNSAMRTVTEVPGSPMCPQGTTLLCRINFSLADAGPPLPCDPFIASAAGLPFPSQLQWWSLSGQLVSAVIVGGGERSLTDPDVDRSNVYQYDPPIAPPFPGPGELVLAPPIDGSPGQLKRVDFCAPSDAGAADATVDAPEDVAADAPADAAIDARRPKTW